MAERIIENNMVKINGEIASDFVFNYEIYGEKFYVADLSVLRESGVVDVVPIMVSDRLIDMSCDWVGARVCVDGQYRSYNKQMGSRSKLILYVFSREFEVEEEESAAVRDKNYIFLDGYICKEPNYRETPLGREIADILLAVNRPYGKSDYIPCICWGRNARFASNLEVGTRIAIEGRIQSREYQKRISDTETEVRIAYEVSVNKINVIEETEE